MSLPEASDEQIEIIKYLDTHNVVVDAVAGSGKSTAAFHIAKKYLKSNILLLTYNSRLKNETRQRVKVLDIHNLEVHSYHSFCYKYYDKKCITDDAIVQMLKKQRADSQFTYDIVIIDEAQDMTMLYYSLVCKIIANNTKNAKLCVVGDRAQSIYAFNNADQRFITLAEKIFNFNITKCKWMRLNLSTSYRITTEMSQFLNKCVLREDRMKAVKHGSRVRYVVSDVFGNDDDSVALFEIARYLETYSYDDIFVLAPSLKSTTTPARILANLLTKRNIPVFVPNSDDEKLDDEVIKGKIVFSTFHQAKGCERKVVLVFCFDEFYMSGIAKGAPLTTCPNALYVAITRAKEHLTVFHHYLNDYLPFISQRELLNYTSCLCHEKIRKKKKLSNSIEKETVVTDLTRFLPSSVILEAKEFIEFEVVQEKQEIIDVPTKTVQGELIENVSEITGTAIPAFLEYLYNGKSSIQVEKPKCLFIDIDDDGNVSNSCDHENIVTEDDDLNKPEILLKVATKYCSTQSGYTFKTNQIKKYDWLSKQNLDKCITRLQKCISKRAIFEETFMHTDKNLLLDRKLVGRIDCIDSKNVWEFKCVRELKNEHIIQLALYAYLVETSERRKHNCNIELSGMTNLAGNNNSLLELISGINTLNFLQVDDDSLRKQYMLFNILNNNIVRLNTTYDKLCDMVKFLIQKKYVESLVTTDKEFLDECRDIANSSTLSFAKYNINI